MKTLYYRETSKGNKILLAISNANKDPLETRQKAIAHAKTSPKFSELQARISSYNEYIQKCRTDGIKFADQGTVPPEVLAEIRNRMLVIKGLQDELLDIQADFTDNQATYMIPASSILADDQTAADLGLAQAEGKSIVLRTDKNGEYAGYDIIDNNAGTKYRLKNSLQWIMAAEPDHEIPAEAAFDEPDEAELVAIDIIRIQGLTDEEKAAEKAAMIETAQNNYALKVIAADLQPDPQAAKDAAQAAYDDRLSDLNTLYK